MPITAAGVTLIAPGLQPQYIAASDESAMGYERLQSELSQGPCVGAYRSGAAVSVPDLHLDDRYPAFSSRALALGLVAVFTFPLRHDEVVLGALDLYHDRAGSLSADYMSAAQTLADVASAYLINAQARSDLWAASQQARDAALHDPLTGLPNRVLMIERIEHALQRARRSEKALTILFIDLDRFKEINDTYGHRVGDTVLIAVAERLATNLRPGDSLARLSGDEFLAICEDLEDASQADVLAARFDAALLPPFRVAGVEITVTASIGIATTNSGSRNPEDLIHTADLAMYLGKRRHIARRQEC